MEDIVGMIANNGEIFSVALPFRAGLEVNKGLGL